jgi:hypothetical protein
MVYLIAYLMVCHMVCRMDWDVLQALPPGAYENLCLLQESELGQATAGSLPPLQQMCLLTEGVHNHQAWGVATMLLLVKLL